MCNCVSCEERSLRYLQWLLYHSLKTVVQTRLTAIFNSYGDRQISTPHKIFLFIPFFFDQPTGQTRGWIFTHYSSKDVKSRKDVPFGGFNNLPQNFWV